MSSDFFNRVIGVSRSSLARLSSDGTPDGGFVPSSGISAVVYPLGLQGDSQVPVGGAFKGGITRWQNSLSLPAPILANPVLCNDAFSVSVTTVNGKAYMLQYKDSLKDSTWTFLQAITGNDGARTLMYPLAAWAQRVYRAQFE